MRRFSGGRAWPRSRRCETFAILAEFGAILLLFEVGLESTPRDMMAVGIPPPSSPSSESWPRWRWASESAADAARRVVDGARLPRGDGWLPPRWGSPLASCRRRGPSGPQAPASSLGAAVIDDVLGLVVLAIIAASSAPRARARPSACRHPRDRPQGPRLPGRAILIGSFLSPRLFRHALALRSTGVVQALALAFCFGLAWLAAKAGLARSSGAFAAGLVMEDVHFGGPPEARREAPPREPARPHRTLRAGLLRAHGSAGARGELREARGSSASRCSSPWRR